MKSFKCLGTALLCLVLLGLHAKPQLVHQLKMSQPQTHYFEVSSSVKLEDYEKKPSYIDFKMAAWTPGSYLIREFARNVEQVHAHLDGKALDVQKINKNTWRVKTAGLSKGTLRLDYLVYAFELSVRTSFLDDSHGYINPASVFMFIKELSNHPIQLHVQPHASFKKVSTAMLAGPGPFQFMAKNLDEFIDSPIEIGNHQSFRFKVGNIPHEIAFYGPAKVDTSKFISDVQSMCLKAQAVVGQHPCDRYLFIIHNLGRGSGGLEHLYSTTCQVSRAAYESPRAYQGILNLLAHEYFHLWNVKRIRPMALGPFDYENENYTHNLWLSEGMTSYYADVISLRAGFVTQNEFINGLADEISALENTPGNRVDPAAGASWDAWIKYYRPNENTRNSSISYYDKGSVLGTVFNLWLIQQSKGKKSLDDVFAYLYQQYYLKLGRGFSDQELEQAFSLVAGTSASEAFRKYVYGVETPDYSALFASVGYAWKDKNQGKSIPFLGFSVLAGKISSVYRGGPAYQDGLNVGDEILKVNDQPFEAMDKLLQGKQVGDVLEFVVRRDGLEKRYAVKVGQSPMQQFELSALPNPSPEQLQLRAKWLN